MNNGSALWGVVKAFVQVNNILGRLGCVMKDRLHVFKEVFGGWDTVKALARDKHELAVGTGDVVRGRAVLEGYGISRNRGLCYIGHIYSCS